MISTVCLKLSAPAFGMLFYPFMIFHIEYDIYFECKMKYLINECSKRVRYFIQLEGKCFISKNPCIMVFYYCIQAHAPDMPSVTILLWDSRSWPQSHSFTIYSSHNSHNKWKMSHEIFCSDVNSKNRLINKSNSVIVL